ncbi:MAG: ATP-grasp domain-containing protein [Egibacteraceae bacterium]
MRNVFVVGLDEPNRELLETLPASQDCRFHTLLDISRLRGVETFPLDDLLAEADAALDAFDGSVDAVTTCIDFPATELVPLLAGPRGLPCPSLEGVLGCNHKHWSRQLQRAAAPEAVPRFDAFDPYLADPLADIEVDFPMWVKPLNAFRSHLGFRITSATDLREALPQIRADLPRLAEPLGRVMDRADLPTAVASAGAELMLAEEILSGRLCTVEGYVQGGQPHVYGVVDSVRAPNRSSFARYQYPSSLPQPIQARIVETAERIMTGIGLDDSPFNMELFYNARRDTIRVLEINPRLSQSHAPLFALVDGVSHLQVMVDLALGGRPALPYRQGDHAVAAKLFLRAYDDGVVVRIPTDGELAELAETVPDLIVHPLVAEGDRLRDLTDQDAYSYELAEVYLGARSHRELLERWRQVRESLPFVVADPYPTD